jgi:putative zinc finger/helix-turn-helix YgiT family protein
MKEHNIDIIETEEQVTFKGIRIKCNATYEYCSNTDEYLETEDMIRANSLAVKDAYRREVGLLTSYEIKRVREKYNISQKEFSEVLNWGKATITRYENHQVQDRAHDDILRKINSDPEWFLEMLERSKERISLRMFSEYYRNAYEQYIKKINPYLYTSISVNVNFDQWTLILDNTNTVRSTNPSKIFDICNGFPYHVKPLFIKENCICAF